MAQSVFQYDKAWELLSTQSFSFVGANFDSEGGGFDKLPGGHSYQVVHVEPRFRYAFGNIGLQSSLLYGYATSENGIDRRTNGAIDHIGLGLDYQLRLGYFNVVPRAYYRLAQSSNDLAQDVVAVGDGVNSFEVGVELRAEHWHLPMLFDVQYLNRSSLSQLLKLRAMAQIPLGSNHLFGGVQGFTTLMGESGSSALARSTWFCRANGCAAYSQALDPGLLAIVGGYSGRNFGVELSHAINGMSVAQDTRVSFFVRLTSRQSNQRRGTSRLGSPPVFIEDTSSEIEDPVFKRPNVINPAVPKKESNPQKSMDQIEMQLELRQKNKKNNR